MKTIIVPTDFSNASTNAVQFAADMAIYIHAKLVICHALPDKMVLVDDLDYNLEDATFNDATTKLDALVTDVKGWTHYQIPVEATLPDGNIDDVLVKTCIQELPFAIIMAATEKSAAERFLLGSETLAVSHKVHVPLLFIPQGSTFEGFKKIAIATDLHNVMDTLPLNSLTRWIATFQPALDIIYVKEADRFQSNNVSEAISLQTHFKDYAPVFRFVNSNNVVKGINEYLDSAQPDLLIIIPHKHSFFHKRVSDYFTLHPLVPTVILSNSH